MLPGISGLILAGGRATRFGEDKSAVRLQGVTLLDRAAALLQSLTDDLIIAARTAGGRHGRARIVNDALADRGPMAGLLAGLRAARHERVLVIPVDMPLLTPPFLRHLILAGAGAEITVPRWRAGVEPLVGIYATTCIPALDTLVRGGITAVHAFVTSSALAVRYVDEPEIRAHGDPDRLFLNINTPDDLTAAEALLRAPPAPDAPP